MNKPKTISMSPVKSGQIAEIGHDGDTLDVRAAAEIGKRVVTPDAGDQGREHSERPAGAEG